MTVFGGAIPVRAPFCEAQEFFFGFPFLPARRGFANHEEVGRMNYAQMLSIRRRIVQLDLNGLIVELKYFGSCSISYMPASSTR